MRNPRMSRLKVPQNAHPLVRELFKEMLRQRIAIADLADKAGIGRDAISAWRYRQSPSLTGIEACFNVLGMELKAAKKKEKA